jgi:diguanylate cyclase (GGDEF)-like protein/PAS domain S-box-containing protein
VSSWNAGAARIKGYTAAEIVGRHFSVFYPRADAASGLCDTLLTEAEMQGRAEHEGWRVRRDGTTFWANVVITALRSGDGTLLGFGKVTRDLTERRLAEQHLEFLANHDPLSGLANRRAFSHALETHLAEAGRTASGSLLLLDIDHFKSVNDTLGHAAGDTLIREVADLLRQHVGDHGELAARLGGDEFALLLCEGGEQRAVETARSIIGRVDAEVRGRYTAVDREITVSVGVCAITDGPTTATSVLAAADLALYDSKRGGRHRFTVAELTTTRTPTEG